MRNPLLLPLIILFCFNCYGQEEVSAPSVSNSNTLADITHPTKKCTLEYAQMPLLKGIRIGMPYESVKEIYPEIETNEWFQKKYLNDKSGLFMIPAKEISNADFRQDLIQLSLNFENDQILVYNFIYKSKKWNSLEEMRTDLSGIFGVDDDYWTVYYHESISMECKDFKVGAGHLTASGKAMNSISVQRK